MSHTRHGLPVLVAGAWCLAMTGWAAEDADGFRAWTDREGNPLEARLVNFNQQTNTVTLRSRNGGTGRFPLLGFSANDQDLVRARFVPRPWTSVDGRTTAPLTYGGIEGAEVLLAPKAGNPFRTPFANLSPADQAFLRRIDPEAAPELPPAVGDAGENLAGAAPAGIAEDPNRLNPDLVRKYAERRTWTIDGATTLDARFVGQQNGTVVLELPDGPRRSVAGPSLAVADTDYIHEFEAKIRALTQLHPWQSAVIRVAPANADELSAQRVLLSNDGTRLAVTYGRDPRSEVRRLRYFDVAKGTVLGAYELPEQLRLPDGGRQSFAFVAPGDAIALPVVEENRGAQTFQTYRVAVMSLTGIVRRNSPPIGMTSGYRHCCALQSSPDGKQLAFAYHVFNAQDRTTSVAVAVLDTASLERLQALTAPVAGDRGVGDRPSLAFSPDGRRLAMLYFGEHLAMWDLTTAQETPIVERARDSQMAVQFDETGSRLFVFGLTSARIIDFGAAAAARDLPLPDRGQTAIAFCPTQPLFATSNDGADPDCIVVLRDVRFPQTLQRLTGHQKTVVHLSFSDDGQRLASLDRDGSVRVWNVNQVY